jgi:hypothetical protein
VVLAINSAPLMSFANHFSRKGTKLFVRETSLRVALMPTSTTSRFAKWIAA